MAARRYCSTATPARRPQQRSRLLRRIAAKTSGASQRSRRTSRATATSDRRRGLACAFGSRRGATHRRHFLPRNHVAAPAEVCESRDPKGHYAKARAGSLPSFTGIANDYQPPIECELKIDTSTGSVADATDEIERMLAETGILFNELVDLAANI